MINFILPDFFCSYKNNKELINEYSYKNIFYGIEGCFSFSIFNGKSNNNNSGSFVSYEDILSSIDGYEEISENLVLIDFGNICLENYDYQDAFGEVVLEEYSTKENIYFEVADENFIEYLVKNYPKIQIILHENYTMFHSEEDIQKIINQYSQIKGIIITLRNLCENIDCKKIGILNLDVCYFCNQYPLCLKKEGKNILRYRKHSQFNQCPKKILLNLDTLIINLKELLKHTNIINFSNIAESQYETYYKIIKDILQKDEEGVFDEVF